MKLKIIISVIGIIGIGLFLYSLSLPIFKDEAKAQEVIAYGQKIEQGDYKGVALYNQQMNDLKTNKSVIRNQGIGLFFVSLMFLSFLLFNKINNISDFKKLRTFGKQIIFLSANLVTVVVYGGLFLRIFLDGNAEHDIMYKVTNIYSPTYIFLIIIFGFISLLFVNLFIAITSIDSKFPCLIFVNPSYQKTKEIIWDIFWSICLLGLAYVLILGFISGLTILIIGFPLFTYILLMLRAGKINKWKYNTEEVV